MARNMFACQRMSLLGCICVCVGICLGQIYAWPHIADRQLEERFYHFFAAQIRVALIETHNLTPANAECAYSYNNDTQTIVDELTARTAVCEQRANSTQLAHEQTIDNSVEDVRAIQEHILQNLQQCRNETDSVRYLNCTQSHFDINMQYLDLGNSLAMQLLSQFVANGTLVDIQRDYCITSAVNVAKSSSIHAANQYNLCTQQAKSSIILDESARQVVAEDAAAVAAAAAAAPQAAHSMPMVPIAPLAPLAQTFQLQPQLP